MSTISHLIEELEELHKRVIFDSLNKNDDVLVSQAIDTIQALSVKLSNCNFTKIEVLRCKNCKHWGCGVAGETKHVKCCEYAKYMVGENGYCAYGEKKG